MVSLPKSLFSPPFHFKENEKDKKKDRKGGRSVQFKWYLEKVYKDESSLMKYNFAGTLQITFPYPPFISLSPSLPFSSFACALSFFPPLRRKM
jgi:hypothetical protein